MYCIFVLFAYQGPPGATGEPGKMLINSNENVCYLSNHNYENDSSVKEQLKPKLCLNIWFVFQDIRNVPLMVSVHCCKRRGFYAFKTGV